MKNHFILTISLLFIPLSAQLLIAADNEYYISTSQRASFNGITFDDDEIIVYHPKGNTLSLFLCDALFEHDYGINALHVKDDGNLILSSNSTGQLGNFHFKPGDLFEYNPSTDAAKLYLNHNLFSEYANINALFIRDNGNIILSTTDSVMLSQTVFSPGDIVEYDPKSQTATVLLSNKQFAKHANVDAVFIKDNGYIVLSTDSTATLCGITFQQGDLVEFDPKSNRASILLNQTNFIDKTVNIDAIHLQTNPLISLASGDGQGGSLKQTTTSYSDGGTYSPSYSTPNSWMPYNAPPSTPQSFSGSSSSGRTEISSIPQGPPPPYRPSNVPEPATVFLLGLGFITIFLRRNRHNQLAR